MNILAISEHYFPRVGGTVNYVHETLRALAALGVEVELLVPGPEPDGWLPDDMASPPYKVTWIDAGYPARGDPTRDQRYSFCRKVDAQVHALIEGPKRPDVLHVLFGLYLMEVLDTTRLRAEGLPCMATVHNVPPMECRQTAHNAPLRAWLIEELRLRAVSVKNRARLRRHQYDQMIVPSEQVRGFLASVVRDPVAVIGHGPTSDLQAQMCPPATRRPDGPLMLLTVGGYAPHKRQHILPETAARLRDAGLDFVWEVVGPTGRVRTYFDDIRAEARARGLQDQLILRESVPLRDLGEFYDRANLYVQPSIEEGFCLTALDAAAVGLPVIASRAGALPDIVHASGGRLVESSPAPLAEAITGFLRDKAWLEVGFISAQVRKRFSWDRAAEALQEHYRRLTGLSDG